MAVGTRTVMRCHLARLHASDVGAKICGAEVPCRAQQGIKGGVHVAGTSAPEHMAPSSAPQILASSSVPCILAPSMHSKPEAKFPLPTLLSFLPPRLGFFLSLTHPIS